MPTTFAIQGNAGVPFATATLSGAASATATADAFGTYTFLGLSAGAYTVTPTLTGFTFTPASKAKTISTASFFSVSFAAADSSTRTSVVDSRTVPNTTVDVQDTQLYIASPGSSYLLPVDSRTGIPVDCRKSPNIPLNSRT